VNLIEQYEAITTDRLKERAIALHSLLKDSHDLETLQEIGRRESAKLRQRYKLSSLGTNLSRAGYYKHFRAIELIEGQNAVQVEKADGSPTLQHAFIAECGLSAKEWDNRNESDRVNNRLSNPRELKPTPLLETALQLINSQDRREIAIGLMLATGRRPHEIFARAKFDLIDNDDWHIRFAGQGKKRDENPIFPIATLLPAKKCRAALNRLRRHPYTKQVIKEARTQHPKDKTAQNQEIDSRTNSSHNRAIEQHLSHLIPQRKGDKNITCKNLRAAYLVMATERDHRNSPIGQKMLHAARLAGHITENDKPSDSDLKHITTTLGYTDYHSPAVPYIGLPPKLKRIEIAQQDLQQLDRWKEEWETGSRHATIEKLIEIARKQQTPPAPEALTPSPTDNSNPTTQAEAEDPTTEPETRSATEQRITALEEKFDRLLGLLTLRQPTPAAPAPAQPVTTPEPTSEAPAKSQPVPTPDPKKQTSKAPSDPPEPPIEPEPVNHPAPKAQAPDPAPKTLTEKNAQAAPKFDTMSYGALTQTKGYGVSFARCQRVYEALQQYNEQYPDPEQRIALNKSLLRSVDGCSNQTASAWMDYHANDLADYHESQGIEDPQYHNRNHHRGYDFPAEIQALLQ